ncbi:type VII secretion protein EccB [Nocardioides sp. LML1-1-1.1]|uniref:type VII secretion protein EccB n=1 Tax=Nocardioides sp. LML1-1-1.1 TaxID=3135248 RepID=UPI0034404B3F
MATKKDLVEAYSFSRRRLVTAFVSGAPGGREVEPARPGRMIVGGIALAVLLIAGAAVAGALTKRPPPDWNNPGLVTDDHGALYVILDSEQSAGESTLRPVINVTSARLILGSDVKTKSVPDKVLATRKKGPSIGILDAPATVPAADHLINSGWVACTANGAGLQADVRRRPSVERAAGTGFVVKAEKSGVRWLIAEAEVPGHPTRAYRYQLPPRNDALDTDLGVTTSDQVTVPDTWLALFPAGGPLSAAGLGVTGWGTPVAGYAGGARVGDYLERNGQSFVLTQQGFAPLTDFALAVVRNTRFAAGVPRKLEPAATDPAFKAADRTYDAASWPEEPVDRSAAATDTVCGVLETDEGTEPAVRLATVPAGAPVDPVAKGERKVAVEAGYGALVRSADFGTSEGGTVALVDDGGRSYSLAGEAEVENLGYKSVPPVVVPGSWVQLFTPGPDLSILDALCPPRTPTQDARTPVGPSCS